jgi:hypothetical protein
MNHVRIHLPAKKPLSAGGIGLVFHRGLKARRAVFHCGTVGNIGDAGNIVVAGASFVTV